MCIRDRLTGESGILAVKARKVLEGTRIGDSIAVNGVCLTVTSIQPDGFTADVLAETIRRSSLGSCKAGSQVNLERAIDVYKRQELISKPCCKYVVRIGRRVFIHKELFDNELKRNAKFQLTM